jgi:exosome complex RNA-binding protein Csl4
VRALNKSARLLLRYKNMPKKLYVSIAIIFIILIIFGWLFYLQKQITSINNQIASGQRAGNTKNPKEITPDQIEQEKKGVIEETNKDAPATLRRNELEKNIKTIYGKVTTVEETALLIEVTMVDLSKMDYLNYVKAPEAKNASIATLPALFDFPTIKKSYKIIIDSQTKTNSIILKNLKAGDIIKAVAGDTVYNINEFAAQEISLNDVPVELLEIKKK